MTRITIAAPNTHISDANQLARVLGYSEDDVKTFGAAEYFDSIGNLYSVASGIVEPVFLINAFSELIEPEWGADMEAAQRAQAILQHGNTEETETCLARPDKIVAVVADDPKVAITLLGLNRK